MMRQSQPPALGRPYVQTVRGRVPASDLGPTLVHEHMLIRNPSFTMPAGEMEQQLALQKVSIENLGWIRWNWTSNVDNLTLDDEAVAVREVASFARHGGRTIVDPTVPGIGRDPRALARISAATGLHIVMGAGWYVATTHPPEVRELDEAGLASIVLSEYHDGVADTGIRPGLIGEIGCSWPLQARERVVLRAMARAHLETGLPLMVHPGRSPAAPAEIVKILRSVGADISRVAIAHLDRTLPMLPDLLRLADTGVFLEVDCFGLEPAHYPFDPKMTTLSDAQRLELVQGLIRAGHRDRVLVAHDICTKHRLGRYGGHGYGHLPGSVVPWMLHRGFDEMDIAALFIHNPAAFLAVGRASS